MSDKYQTEVHRRIYDNENGHHLTVRPSADFPDGNIMIFTDKDEEDWFGPIRLDMPAAFMRRLGQALIDAAKELEA